MHQLRSHSLLRAYRLAALLFCLKFLLLILGGIVLAYAGWENSWRIALLGCGLGAASIVASISRILLAGFVRCPLCAAAVFSPLGSTKHSKARKFLGSYRLPVALSILFRNHFLCPYCHEPTAMQVRPRPTERPRRFTHSRS